MILGLRLHLTNETLHILLSQSNPTWWTVQTTSFACSESVTLSEEATDQRKEWRSGKKRRKRCCPGPPKLPESGQYSSTVKEKKNTQKPRISHSSGTPIVGSLRWGQQEVLEKVWVESKARSYGREGKSLSACLLQKRMWWDCIANELAGSREPRLFLFSFIINSATLIIH